MNPGLTFLRDLKVANKSLQGADLKEPLAASARKAPEAVEVLRVVRRVCRLQQGLGRMERVCLRVPIFGFGFKASNSEHHNLFGSWSWSTEIPQLQTQILTQRAQGNTCLFFPFRCATLSPLSGHAKTSAYFRSRRILGCNSSQRIPHRESETNPTPKWWWWWPSKAHLPPAKPAPPPYNAGSHPGVDKASRN